MRLVCYVAGIGKNLYKFFVVEDNMTIRPATVSLTERHAVFSLKDGR